MTEQEFRERMRKASDEEIKPIVEKMTNLIMDAYQSGFNVAMSLFYPTANKEKENGKE